MYVFCETMDVPKGKAAANLDNLTGWASQFVKSLKPGTGKSETMFPVCMVEIAPPEK